MLIKQIIEVFDLLDSPHACGEEVKAYLQSKGRTISQSRLSGTENTPRILSKSSSPERMEGLPGELLPLWALWGGWVRLAPDRK